MIETTKISSRGQLVIPESIRKSLKLKEGTKIVLIEKNGKITLEKEEDFLKNLDLVSREETGWLRLAEKSLAAVWDNEKDEQVWKKYL